MHQISSVCLHNNQVRTFFLLPLLPHNSFTAMHAAPSLGKRPIKSAKFGIIKAFSPFALVRERIFIKMHSAKSRFVIGPSNILFAGMYMCTFQPGNFTGWGSERVKALDRRLGQHGHKNRSAHTQGRPAAAPLTHQRAHQVTSPKTEEGSPTNKQRRNTGLCAWGAGYRGFT